MSKMIKQAVILLLLSIMIMGCTSNLYTRMGSTAPTFGPLYMGMTRIEAERYLGTPILKIPIDKTHYRIIYEYEAERSALFTASTDMADILTLGLTNMMISPIDRFNGTRHLIGVLFEMRDAYEENDQIRGISEKL